MEETILTAQNLKFRYDSDQPVYALDGVSTEVKRGEFVAVLGANGCGKSTLAKHFNAILLPESGKVYVEGMDTADDDKIYDIRQTVGMVFQNPDNQIVATVVEEDVAFALENLGVPPEEMRRRVDDSSPLVRCGNDIYYGSMKDPFVVYLQVLSTKKENGVDVADKVHIVLLSTDESKPLPERIARQANKVGLYNALSFGDIMLQGALRKK